MCVCACICLCVRACVPGWCSSVVHSLFCVRFIDEKVIKQAKSKEKKVAKDGRAQ